MTSTTLFACLRLDWISGQFAWTTFPADNWDAARSIASHERGFSAAMGDISACRGWSPAQVAQDVCRNQLAHRRTFVATGDPLRLPCGSCFIR